MGTKARELIFEPDAAMLLDELRPSEEELPRLIAKLQELKRNPAQGVRVEKNPYFYIEKDFYVLEIGRFVVHYTFDETRVKIGWIGIY